MFVTNHVLSGIVIGRLLERHPVSAFLVGVGSHLALDMGPTGAVRRPRVLAGSHSFAMRNGMACWASSRWRVLRVPWTGRLARQQSQQWPERCCSTQTSRCCTSSGAIPSPRQ
jgi:hypothetical protein